MASSFRNLNHPVCRADWLPLAFVGVCVAALWLAMFERARHEDALLLRASAERQADLARHVQISLDQAIVLQRAADPRRPHAPVCDTAQDRACTPELLALHVLARDFDNPALGRSGELILLGADGQELGRLQDGLLAPTRSIAGTQRFRLAFAREPGTLSETVHGAIERLYAFRRLETAPLAVLVSRTHYDILRDNKSTQRAYWLTGTIATLAALGFALLWLWLAARRRRLLRTMANSAADTARLIRQLDEERTLNYRMATHDKLTGLANRMLFAEVAERHRARARRQRKRFALMFVDLDRFKPINDSHGHKVGDQLLLEVARRLTASVRETDMVARLGGDEFVLLLADLHGSSDAERIASTVITSLSAPVGGIAPVELRITPSLGIAFYPDDAEDIEALLRQADAAMYQAKAQGRATWAFADPALNRQNELHNRIEALLPQALRDGSIALHYQPKVDLADFRIVGLEALARWPSSPLGPLSPADFVHVAERSGRISELGEYVVETACRQMAAWRTAGLPPLPVAVNVSPRQLRSPQLYECIVAALDRYDLAPRLLEIEITETGLLEANERCDATIARLDALGIGIAIDDFGTGFSGLSHLRRLPAKTLKIDRSFIRDIRNDVNDAKIVGSTIALAHNLKIAVVAEGVELPEQVAHLKANGCDQAQGWLFAKAMPGDEIIPLLRAGHCPPGVGASAASAAAGAAQNFRLASATP